MVLSFVPNVQGVDALCKSPESYARKISVIQQGDTGDGRSAASHVLPYLACFGLSAAPFSIAVDPHYLYLSSQHREALAHLLYGVDGSNGFVLLTGEVGTGKTTVNRCLLAQLPESTDLALILNPGMAVEDLLATVCDELGIEYTAAQPTLKQLSDALYRFLLDNHRRGRRTVILIDEAQHLSYAALEQLRLLTNLETSTEKLLQIVLIGQPELESMLARPELRQFNQRVVARFRLGRLSPQETPAYIAHRLRVAGLAASAELFTPQALRAVYRYSGGIPRVINVICDRALLGAFGQHCSRIDAGLVAEAAAEVTGQAPKAWTRWRSVWPVAIFASALLVGVVLVAVFPRDSVDPVRAGAAVLIETSAAPGVPAVIADDRPPEWRFDNELAGLRALWRWAAPEVPTPMQPCRTVVTPRIECISGQARSWEELRELGRPALVELIGEDRRSNFAVVTGFAGSMVELWAPAGPRLQAIAELGREWTGLYQVVWRPPEGFERPLMPGDRGPAVAALGVLFAELDGEAEPLTHGEFNAALRQRVRLFQRQQGLVDDGIAGQQTLLRLNAQLGRDRLLHEVSDGEG